MYKKNTLIQKKVPQSSKITPCVNKNIIHVYNMNLILIFKIYTLKPKYPELLFI